MFYLSCHFINLSKVYPGPCARVFFISGKRVARKFWIFVLRFPEWPFLGLVGKASFPPIVFWYVHHSWHLPISGVVYFHKLSFPAHWPFINIWNPFYYWVFLSNRLCLTCSGGSEVAGKLDLGFRTSSVFLHLVFLAFSARVDRSELIRPLVWRHFCGVLVPWFPV